MPVSRKWRGALTAGLALLLVVGSAACGSSSKKSDSATNPTTNSTGTTNPADLLGPVHRATGSPVKVGLLTTGGSCSGCTSNYEAPAAQAGVDWLNEYNNGLAGHPITLDVCVDNNDPAKGTDCANQMIRDKAAAVVLGSSGITETEWKILHDTGTPVVNHSATQPALIQDAKSTFIIYDPEAQTVTLPIAVAKDKGAKKLSLVVVDFPTATDIYKTDATKQKFKDAGLDFTLIPVPLGQADLTPQMQQVIASNPDGVVAIIGSDVTCIPALNALHSLGFQGTLTTISYCITDAMRKAVAGNIVKGVRFGAEAPFGDMSDHSMQQYAAVLDKYAKGKVPVADQPATTVFQSVAAIGLGAAALKGAVTPASVTAAMKSMDNATLPAAGGRVFRCNGKASAEGPAICSVSTVTGTLDSKGKPAGYKVDNNEPIPG
jgi:ABC-type branched-subunit amino acid transport system substrate-binding protein